MGIKATLGNPIIDFVFPRICLVCSSNTEYLCDHCLAKIKKARLKCLRCNKNNPFGRYCFSCEKPFLPDKIISAFVYRDHIKNVIHQYKYEDAFILAKDLAKALLPLVRSISGYRKFTLSFIPLSDKKFKTRGYNQAELLAREAGKLLNMRVANLMNRSTQEETQVTSKTKRARKQNIKGVFKIKNGVSVPANIILVDDVVTTGATVEEATKVLKRAGAKKVVVVALAMA